MLPPLVFIEGLASHLEMAMWFGTAWSIDRIEHPTDRLGAAEFAGPVRRYRDVALGLGFGGLGRAGISTVFLAHSASASSERSSRLRSGVGVALTATVDLVIAGVGLAEAGRFERDLLAMEYARSSEGWQHAKGGQVGGYFFSGSYVLIGVLESVLAVTLFATAGPREDATAARPPRLVPMGNGFAVVGEF